MGKRSDFPRRPRDFYQTPACVEADQNAARNALAGCRLVRARLADAEGGP